MRLIVYLLIMMCIGGLTPIAARLAVAEMPPMAVAWVRFAMAGALLWLTLRAKGMELRFERSHLGGLLLLAVLCVPINQLGFLGGIRLANASHAALFYAMTPVLVFWGSVIVRRARYSGMMLTGAALAFAGAACVLWPSIVLVPTDGARWQSMLVGDLLLLLAVASWAAFIVASKMFLETYGPLPTLTAVFLLGAIIHTPFGLWAFREFDWASVTMWGVLGFLFITCVSSYAGYLLTYAVIARHDATRAMIVVNAQFLLTVLIEWVAFKEPLTLYFAAGSVLIFAAIGLDMARIGQRQRASDHG